MNTRAGMFVLVLVGLAFCGVGWLGLTQPRTLMEPIGVELTDLRTLNEVTANYGGMHFALGLFFVLSAFVGSLRAGGLLAALAFLSGLVGGRIASFVRDGVPEGSGGAMMFGLLAVETIGLLLVFGALLKRRGGRRAAAAAPAPSPAVSSPRPPAAPSPAAPPPAAEPAPPGDGPV